MKTTTQTQDNKSNRHLLLPGDKVVDRRDKYRIIKEILRRSIESGPGLNDRTEYLFMREVETGLPLHAVIASHVLPFLDIVEERSEFIPESDVIGRILREQAELDSKILKLSAFIQSHDFRSKLPIEHRKLLAEQQDVMEQYSKILVSRVALLSKK